MATFSHLVYHLLKSVPSGRALRVWLAVWLCGLSISSLFALGEAPFISFSETAGGLEIASSTRAVPWVVDADAWPGVHRVAELAAADVERVVGVRPAIQSGKAVTCVLVGTLGRGGLMDELARRQPALVERLRGKWEAFVIQVVDHPLEGVEKALVVVGSDKRGTEYGLFEVSSQIGVSPWNWWADVPVTPRERLVVTPGDHGDGEPAVRYRGIFLNDEAPALSGWAKEKFGGLNSRFYERLFELLLRLKANYLWPAMWNNAFNEDDPENPRLADLYGIVMGTSHHEPMLRAQQEWKRHGTGKWDYSSNSHTLSEFWRAGVRRNRLYESLFTLGMRGDGDEPMTEGENVALLERIVADQREILRREVSPELEKVPQLWALYKEVQGYYERGMRVPGDVTLLWCDDNWGNIRRLPTPEEQQRPGGAGVYYHFDYVGGPRNYKWLNTVPIDKVREQMNQALERKADRIWIVNVGDLKLLEFPTEFFLEFARHPERWPGEKLDAYTEAWARRDFGDAKAAEIAYLIKHYTRLNGFRKPELLEPTTFSLVNFGEAERVEASWDELVARAQALESVMPAAQRDAFFQLVRFPIQASAQVVKLYLAAGRNRLYATQGRLSTNEQAALAEKLFEADRVLTEEYNEKLAGGKWRHMADQTHLGYTYWQQPPCNVMPAVSRVQERRVPSLGVAVEGSLSAWPGDNPYQEKAQTPALHRQVPTGTWFELFRRGGDSVEVTVTPEEAWLEVSWSGGRLEHDRRVEISAKWEAVPVGKSQGHVRVRATSGENVLLTIPLVNETIDFSEGYLETHARVVFEAVHPTSVVSPAAGRWQVLKDFGAGAGAVTTLPVALPSVEPGKEAPRLDFVWTGESAGAATLRLRFSPGLDTQPGKLRCAISLDGGALQIVDVATRTQDEWAKAVSDGVREISLPVQVKSGRRHVLSYWMIDSGVVFERAVLSFGSLPPSYFGPPESPRVGSDALTFPKL